MFLYSDTDLKHDTLTVANVWAELSVRDAHGNGAVDEISDITTGIPLACRRTFEKNVSDEHYRMHAGVKSLKPWERHESAIYTCQV